MKGNKIVQFCILAASFVILLGCKAENPSAPTRICSNLVDAGYVETAEYVAERVYSDFIPHYFRVGEATFDYVSAGMQGFEVLDFSESSSGCPGDFQRHVYIEYRTGNSEYVGLHFCDSLLWSISYHE